MCKINSIMAKKYFYIIALLSLFATANGFAQDTKPQSKPSEETTIEGLSFYPNPVSGGKIYITSKSGEDKEITIFDVLGKKVLQTILTGRELNIGTLQPGVYIIKFKEEDATATRKLIVK